MSAPASTMRDLGSSEAATRLVGTASGDPLWFDKAVPFAEQQHARSRSVRLAFRPTSPVKTTSYRLFHLLALGTQSPKESVPAPQMLIVAPRSQAYYWTHTGQEGEEESAPERAAGQMLTIPDMVAGLAHMMSDTKGESGHQVREAQVLDAYTNAALKRAQYENLPDDEGFYGIVPELPGVWGNDDTIEGARSELSQAIHGWTILALKRGVPTPELDGINPSKLLP